MNPSSATEIIASQGVLGALVVLLLALLLHKDRQLKAESDARISDAKEYAKLAREIQKDVYEKGTFDDALLLKTGQLATDTAELLATLRQGPGPRGSGGRLR